VQTPSSGHQKAALRLDFAVGFVLDVVVREREHYRPSLGALHSEETGSYETGYWTNTVRKRLGAHNEKKPLREVGRRSNGGRMKLEHCTAGAWLSALDTAGSRTMVMNSAVVMVAAHIAGHWEPEGYMPVEVVDARKIEKEAAAVQDTARWLIEGRRSDAGSAE
jgi:hypothetical protein